MQNPFSTLGIAGDASAEQVRAAYHACVKRCHPDRMQDIAAQLAAKDELVRINLAYKEALRQAMERQDKRIVMPDAKQLAQKLYEQGHLDSALRILNKAPERDADWFALQGSVLLKKGEAEAAHACFRTAVRMCPEDIEYRKLALSAGVEMRKKKNIGNRMGTWARGVVSRVL
ncbi:MAG: DnaJ domain-containing protein [Firmicutes bacterium]|nr:DnaJ domain-containing protein [Bacillota bacterium]